VLLFGGSDGERDENVLGDTALWDGARWRALAPEHAPPARLLHAMAWDAGRDVVVLFGGALAYGADPGLPQEDAFADTWEWDGEDWRELEPRTVPPARVGHRLVYDASRARVVLLGTAIEADTDYAVTWEWDGVDWTERQQEVSPTPRLGAAVAYDAARGEVVASSGTGECPWGVGPVGHCGTIWSYAPGRARPHLVTTFDLRASHTLEPTGRDRSGRTLLETAIRTRAGGIGHGWGTGRADGAPAPGYEVAVAAFGWGGWVPVHESNQATPAQPEDWTGEFDRAWRCGEPHCEAADITRWSDLDGRLHLDVAARSPRGAAASDGGVALDYVELRLSYWRTGCESPSERLPAGTPDDTPCSDGLPETAGERCLAGECTVP